MSIENAIFSEHWPHVVTIVMWLATVINGHTKNWKAWPGRIGKVLGLLLKVIGLWTADRPKGWRPGDPDRRKFTTAEYAALGTIVLMTLSGCTASSIGVGLDGIHATAVSAREVGLPLMNKECQSIAMRCIENDKTEDQCEELKVCQEDRRNCVDLIRSMHLSVISGRLALSGNSLDAAAESAGKAASYSMQAKSCVDGFIGMGVHNE